MEGEFDGKAWWSSWHGSVIEASSWAFIFLACIFTLAILLLLLVLLLGQCLGLLIKFGRIANSPVPIRLGGDLLVVHGCNVCREKTLRSSPEKGRIGWQARFVGCQTRMAGDRQVFTTSTN